MTDYTTIRIYRADRARLDAWKLQMQLRTGVRKVDADVVKAKLDEFEQQEAGVKA